MRRARIFSHYQKGHFLSYKQEGAQYNNVYFHHLEVSVDMLEPEFYSDKEGIFCHDCMRYIGTYADVDEFL